MGYIPNLKLDDETHRKLRVIAAKRERGVKVLAEHLLSRMIVHEYAVENGGGEND